MEVPTTSFAKYIFIDELSTFALDRHVESTYDATSYCATHTQRAGGEPTR